jgi:hypothetical protein
MTVQPINNRQTPLGTRIESTLFNILILISSNITSDMDIADYISTEFYELL